MAFIVAIDQSTSATKAFVIDEGAGIVERCSVEHTQYYPQRGFVEHDPDELFRNTVAAVRCVVEKSGIDESSISALSITNQRETALVWNRRTGEPVARAAVWQCLRGENICASLRGYTELIAERTGLILDPYFSASKIRWILDHTAGAQKAAEAGDLLFGTIDSWLVWKLTGGEVHITDTSNACRTMLFNIENLDWDFEMLRLFNIPRAMAPEVVSADTVVGGTKPGVPFAGSVPIAGILGDSHAALFGRKCFEKGSAKASYGTGSSIMMNVGDRPLRAGSGLVSSVGYTVKGNTSYVLEGNIHCTGCTIQWMVDDLRLIPDAASSESIAREVDSADGVYLVPAFAGLGAPYWDNEAKAAIVGMTRGTSRGHVVRAGLESIAYQVADLIDAMETGLGTGLDLLKVDGGPSANTLLMQFQADILNTAVSSAAMPDVSAIGSAFAAGLAVGMWGGLEDLQNLGGEGAHYMPAMDMETRLKLRSGWQRAVAMVQSAS